MGLCYPNLSFLCRVLSICICFIFVLFYMIFCVNWGNDSCMPLLHLPITIELPYKTFPFKRLFHTHQSELQTGPEWSDYFVNDYNTNVILMFRFCYMITIIMHGIWIKNMIIYFTRSPRQRVISFYKKKLCFFMSLEKMVS